ncbi:MAG: NAD-dependent epimerase/dehydratase family protein [Flavobacterium sp.]|nr:NAD-dependent epimerase/dehydratase family protein [Flavobacterium sp.]MBP6074320.1 NAD-dependent epimerase/dehydratase family protein [Flavobacterium sp.]
MILVTGATGLVGSHLLVALLQENEAVKALYRSNAQIEKTKKVFAHKNQLALFDNIQWVKGDITDIPSLERAFEKVTHVYHCAAVVSFDPKEEEKIRKVNIEGTAHIVNCCLDFKIKKLCHVSSIAALGDTKAQESLITEETEWNFEKQHSDYAITKYGAEMEVWRGFQEGLEVVIVNPGVIFGYGFSNLGSDLFIQWVKKRIPFYTKGIIGIVGVQDVVTSMITLMKSEISGERFIVVGENCSYKELFDCLAHLLHTKSPFIKASKIATAFVWRFDWLWATLTNSKRKLTKATAASSHATALYSSKKIEATIGITFAQKEIFLPEVF